MEPEQPEFELGETVQQKNQPEIIGVVRDRRWNEQAESWDYSVQFGARSKLVPGEQLQRLQLLVSPWEALESQTFSGIQHFIFTLTFHRLRRPPTRIANSFATSRTQFYPHQFKPLLKFLDNPSNRLLIADDVGLGKTIEAGYIMRELEARQVVDHVLVVVPARLKSKWKRELRDRFEEHFDEVKASDLMKLADRIRQGREPDPFRWIVSYESARPDEIRKALEETRPVIDVMIADEAHRMRNPESLQHKIGSTLCKCADTVLFLSATPVQNRMEDLWHLLRLLSPEEFSSWTIFADQMQANSFLLRAQKALRQRPTDVNEARQNLQRFLDAMGDRLVGAELLASMQERLSAPRLERRDLVELEADIGALSPIGHILSRTRKVEALPNRAHREATWKSVSLSPSERQIYDNVENLCRLAWMGGGSSWGFQMALIMAYRITASCIPAAMAYFADRLKVQSRELPISQVDEEGATEDVRKESSPQNGSEFDTATRQGLAEIVDSYRALSLVDSKLQSLTDLLSEIWRADDAAGRDHRKVVVFSFFRRTLEYLARSLETRQIRNRMIHGLINVDDRESAIDDFLLRKDISVLLTSEVGGEGIDLQRASIVVNYDLPWNPMVVEQRIGRVDRIGQEADKILVYNLIVADSIEERILQRLLQKLGIFRETIGEIEPIIGEQIEKLGAAALSGEFTSTELERKVEDAAKALEQQMKQAREVLSHVDDLLAADQNLIDEISAVTQEHQIPSESDLLLFLNTFLAKRFAGCQIPGTAAGAVVKVDLRGGLSGDLEREAPNLGLDVGVFARRIAGGPIDLTLSREVGYRHSRCELLNLRHPLVRFAVGQSEGAGDTTSTAFSLRLKKSKVLAAGTYGFLIASVELKGSRPTTRLAAVFASLDSGEVTHDQEKTTPAILELLQEGEDVAASRLTSMQVSRLKLQLTGGLNVVTKEWNVREEQLDVVRRQLRSAAVLGALDLKVKRAQEGLATLRSQEASPFAIRMAEAKLEKATRESDGAKSVQPKSSWGGLETEEIALGILSVA